MCFEYHVELIRFRESGKFYDVVSFGTNSTQIHDIVDEIKAQAKANVISNCFNYMLTGREGGEDGELYSGNDLHNGFPVFINICK